MRIWLISSIKCRIMCTTHSSSVFSLLPVRNHLLLCQSTVLGDHLSLCHRVIDTSSKVLVYIHCYSFYFDFLLAENLEKLAFELSRMPLPDESEETDLDEEQSGSDRFMGLIAGNEVTNQHQRFLMVLSNAGFCNSHLLPELSRKYQYVWSYAG